MEAENLYKGIVKQKGISRYYQVAMSIKEAIGLGYHGKGEKLPSEDKLTELFGVSRVTVRKALDELKREGVIEKIWGSGVFVKKELASPPGKKQSIGFLVYNDEGIKYHPAITDIVRGINSVISGTQYGLNIFSIMPEMLEDSDSGRFLSLYPAAGLIVYSEEIPDAYIEGLRNNLPCIVAAGARPSLDLPCVIMDLQEQLYKLTEYLIGIGHDRIAFLESPSKASWAKKPSPLYTSFRRALKDCRVNEKRIFFMSGDYTSESGYDLTIKLLGSKPSPTAIIANDDIMALGVIKAVRKAGKRCPEDVSVASLNDFPFSEYAHPPLTTAKAPFDELGKELALSLLESLSGIKPDNKIITRSELMIRGSTAPPGRVIGNPPPQKIARRGVEPGFLRNQS